MKIGISRKTFRWVIVITFLLDIFLTTYWRTDSHWLPESIYDVLASSLNYVGTVLPEGYLNLWWDLSVMAHWFCYIALFFFWPVGRWILLILTVLSILIAPFLGVSAAFGWVSLIGGLTGTLGVFLLTLSFFSPLAAEFERKDTP